MEDPMQALPRGVHGARALTVHLGHAGGLWNTSAGAGLCPALGQGRGTAPLSARGIGQQQGHDLGSPLALLENQKSLKKKSLVKTQILSWHPETP